MSYFLYNVFMKNKLLPEEKKSSGEEDINALKVRIKELEQELERLNNLEREKKMVEVKYEELLQRSSDIIFVHCKGKIVLITPKGARFLGGKSTKDIIGEPFMNFVPQNYREISLQRIRKVLEEGEEVGFIEGKIRRLDGKEVDVDVCATPFNYRGEKAIKSYARDISERKKLEEELKESNKKLSRLSLYQKTILEKERARISRELHDEIGQLLTVLKMNIAKSLREPKIIKGSALQNLQTALEITDLTIQKVSEISYRLRPKSLDYLSFSGAVRDYLKNFQSLTGIECKIISIPEDISLSKQVTITIFRILQEGMSNVFHHSKATKVKILMKKSNSEFLLKISDNGIGMPREYIYDNKSLGIVDMVDRATSLGGRLKIHPGLKKGTILEVRIPLKEKSNDKNTCSR